MGSMVSGNHVGAKHMSGRFMQTFPRHQIEAIVSVGTVNSYMYSGQLPNSSVQRLVQTMAGFTPPPGQSAITEASNSGLYQLI
jgi:hypothetical protein